MGIQENVEKMFFESAGGGYDQGSLAYDLFEEKHHLLESLTRRQIELIVPTQPKRVLDVGCGTGISAMILYNSLSTDRPPRIFAMDICNYSLLKAKERYRNNPGLYFVQGDADNLDSFFHEGFDGIFYTPSLFQVPNFRESIRQAAGLAVPGGVISICSFDGLFTENGEDAFLKAFPDLKTGGVTSWKHEAESFFGSSKGFRFTRFDFRLEAGGEFLLDFLSIPGRSRALFPKIPQVDRISKIRETCTVLEGKAGRIFMGWTFLIARKEHRLDS